MKTLHKSLPTAFLAVSFLISGFKVDFAGTPNTALGPVTVQLRWFPQVQLARYYAAVEKGFYAEESLQVSLRDPESSKDRITPVLAG